MAAVAVGVVPLFHHRRKKSPLTGTFFAPVDLADLDLVQALASISAELISIANPSFPFQHRNTRNLILKVRSFLSVFEFLIGSGGDGGGSPRFVLSSSVSLCFKELYILLYRSKFLLEYCSQSSRLWLLLRNCQISGNFHDLTLELSTLLDVFPSDDQVHELDRSHVDLHLPVDLKEQINLVRSQTTKPNLYIDEDDENLRLKIYEFLSEFEQGREPDPEELKAAFIDRLGIRDARICRTEIEFLEEQIYNQEDELDSSVLDSVVALTRYARFLLFGFGHDVDFRKFCSFAKNKSMKGKILQDTDGDYESYVQIPKDFLCPISLDLMRDPVVVSTGQTYDRESILRWMQEGHKNCPNSGQVLVDGRVIPNRALRNLIYQWCAVNSVAYDSPEHSDGVVLLAASKSAMEANKFTTKLLIRLLMVGSEDAKTTAARELRLLARTAKENREFIAEVGAISLLRKLLWLENPIAQENAVTALLNLSIHEKNKSKIMDEEGCLRSIVNVLIHGLTTEAKENAAATLFSLSVVHDYKKMITDVEGAAEALAELLMKGTPRGKKDAVTALFNLSTHTESCQRMVDSGATAALVGALETESVAEEAAGALALLVRQQVALQAVAYGYNAVEGLVGLIRRGSPKAKENAVAALVEMCRSGGAKVMELVAGVPTIVGLIQNLLLTGTKRARRKAASLVKMFVRQEASGEIPYGGWAVQFPMRRLRSIRRPRPPTDESSDLSAVPISVPVL